MHFIPIFNFQETSVLWSVCYPEDQIEDNLKDVYSILMDELWSDVLYLFEFIKKEIKTEGYDASFWNRMSIQEIIDKILDEVKIFDEELSYVESLDQKNASRRLDKIFVKLHQNIYSLNSTNDSHRKARPKINKSIIRLYGIELSDKTIIITGGTLKLKLKMVGVHFDKEIRNLKRVEAYLKSQGIIDRNGLIE